jgi:glutathione S-transferase
MRLELISFKLCPFVQRAVITLLHRKVPHEVTYIDLADPPQWFLDISPFGQVPVLKADDTPIFESAVINEFIDEASPGPSLQPADPLQRALNRAWTELGSACLGDTHRIVTARDADALEDARDDLQEKLERLEEQLGAGPFFNGADLALIDTAFAPLFMRLAILDRHHQVLDRESIPKVTAWSEHLLALPVVRDSVASDFESAYLGFVRAQGGLVGQSIEA